MSVYDELRNINIKAEGIAQKFLSTSLRYAVQSVRFGVETIIKLALILAGGAVYLFKNRGQIVGGTLLVAGIVVLFGVITLFLPFKEQVVLIKDWFIDSYNGLIVLFPILLILALCWNYVSPTLRSWFGKGVWRIVIWGLAGVGLIGFNLSVLSKTDTGEAGIYEGILVLFIVALGLLAKVFPPKKPYLSPSVYVEDNPKAHELAEPYESQRKVIAEAKYLINGGLPSVFAISGHWGSGKTFLLERIRADLDSKIIWVNFEPWRYASEEALIRGFYQDISSKLGDEIKGFQSIAKPLAGTVDNFVRQKDDTGILGMVSEFIRKVSIPAEDPETQIKSVLKREGRRLVITIDDVERSYSPERIFRTLQLAHFSKNISNVQVVFLCEREVIERARPPHFNDKSDYLEKFIEKEIIVPSPRPSELRGHFQQLASRLNDVEFSERDLSDGMMRAVSTPRGVLRLFNEYALFHVNVERGEE